MISTTLTKVGQEVANRKKYRMNQWDIQTKESYTACFSQTGGVAFLVFLILRSSRFAGLALNGYTLITIFPRALPFSIAAYASSICASVNVRSSTIGISFPFS